MKPYDIRDVVKTFGYLSIFVQCIAISTCTVEHNDFVMQQMQKVQCFINWMLFPPSQAFKYFDDI